MQLVWIEKSIADNGIVPIFSSPIVVIDQPGFIRFVLVIRRKNKIRSNDRRALPNLFVNVFICRIKTCEVVVKLKLTISSFYTSLENIEKSVLIRIIYY